MEEKLKHQQNYTVFNCLRSRDFFLYRPLNIIDKFQNQIKIP